MKGLSSGFDGRFEFTNTGLWIASATVLESNDFDFPIEGHIWVFLSHLLVHVFGNTIPNPLKIKRIELVSWVPRMSAGRHSFLFRRHVYHLRFSKIPR